MPASCWDMSWFMGGHRYSRRVIACVACLAVVAAGVITATVAAPVAASSRASLTFRQTMPDGTSIYGTVAGAAPLAPRPVVIEFSVYGEGAGYRNFGDGYNAVSFHLRGTGQSSGRFDLFGPQTQDDMLRLTE